MAEIKKISTELQLLDKFLDTSGDAGTSGQVLTSTGTGINWVSGGSLPGGPYLPLSAGSTKPLSGVLYAGQGVKFTGGTIAQATAVLHTNNILYFRGGPSGFYLQNGDGSDGYYISPTYHKWEVNNSESMRLTSAGLGIGTTTPGSKLEVNVSDDTFNDIDVLKLRRTWSTASGSDRAHGISFNDTNAVNAAIYADRTNSGSNYNSDLVFITNTGASGTNTSEKMRITSAGNVGIGDASPTSISANTFSLSVNSSRSDLSGALISKANGTVKHQQYWDSSGYGFNLSANSGNFKFTGGNVGIGTTSPDAPLTVKGETFVQEAGTNGNAAIRVQYGTDGDTALRDRARLMSVGYNGVLELIDQTNALKTKINSNGSSYLNGGNVGIGTNSPGAKLQIGSATYAPNANLGNNLLQIKSASGFAYLTIGNGDSANATSYIGGASGFIVLGSVTDAGAKSEHIRMTNTGNVGIGTTSPASKLTVSGDANVTAKFAIGIAAVHPTIDFYNQGTAYFNGSTTVDDNLIVTNGKVGIGTSTPSQDLEILNGTTGSGIRLAATNTAYWDIERDSTSGHLTFTDDGAGTVLTVGQDGNVGIGTTSPAVQLELGNNTADEKLRLTGAASGKPLMTFYNTTTKIGQIASSSVGVTVTSLGSGNMSFENGGSTRLAIENGGNVGIGDTTPSYKLDVDGTIRATGDVIAYSDVRVKENIKTIDNALEKVNKLRGVEFNKIGSEEKSIGVIAQEIEKVLPEVVKEDEKGMKSVAYGNIVGVLIEAVKDQQKQIDELKSIINGGTK